MYERRGDRLLPTRLFARRVTLHAAAALALVVGSLALGMAGYMRFEHLPWRDAFLNCAMLLGGMGPVDAPKSDAARSSPAATRSTPGSCSWFRSA